MVLNDGYSIGFHGKISTENGVFFSNSQLLVGLTLKIFLKFRKFQSQYSKRKKKSVKEIRFMVRIDRHLMYFNQNPQR